MVCDDHRDEGATACPSECGDRLKSRDQRTHGLTRGCLTLGWTTFLAVQTGLPESRGSYSEC